ncbi:hypothetical protein PAEH1_01430 [Paenalcaligenes hominis]|uniref:Uncharacterized protein n=1 Tax=Paenalcaligenes hominis TaxID=643674 RepID=A0A1U9JXP4_9BURK|nr:hypothetical protein [Paenalcaligenes hominis]AQS50542.1 hypothetical protein PAEH1_01430 [Paenalcaligenes hominis]
MVKLDNNYEVRDPEGHLLAIIKNRKFKHLSVDVTEYLLTEEGLTDMQGVLVAKWDECDLVRLDDGVTRFTLRAID